MRKFLLASSALVAGTAFATAAQAGAPELNISGKINFEYVTSSVDDDSLGNSTAGTQQVGANPFMTELTFDVNAESDSGLKYGGRIELRTTTAANERSVGTYADEAWIDIAGSFGRVVIGKDDGAGEGNLYNGGSVLVGSYGFTGTFDAGTNNFDYLLPGHDSGSAIDSNDDTAGDTSDNSKVTYFTPVFSGFQAGISFTPETSYNGPSSTTTLTVDTTDGTDDPTAIPVDSTTTTSPGTYDKHLEFYAAWNGEIADGVSFGINGLYKDADANDASVEDLEAYEIGAILKVGDLAVSAGYYDNGDSGIAKNSDDDAGEAISFGVAYSFGDLAVSAGYFEKEVEHGGATDSYENISLDVEYTIAEGLSTYAGVQFAEGEDGSENNSADANVVIIGTRLRF